MSIESELSSDIAEVMLSAERRSPEEREKIKRVLQEVHEALSQLSRRQRRSEDVLDEDRMKRED